MGVLSDLLASPATFGPANPPRTGTRRADFDEIRDLKNRIGDFDYPSGYAARNEVQSIAKYSGSVTGGNFTLTFTLKDGTTFTTADIAHDADAATIQSAIDTAAAGVTGWADGDIAITGGDLTSTAITITFSGNSVKNKNHSQTTIDGTGLTGGGTAGAASTTTQGQSNRSAWAALKVLGIITSDPGAQGTDPSNVTANKAPFPHGIANDTVKALIDEASIEDANLATKTALLAALGL